MPASLPECSRETRVPTCPFRQSLSVWGRVSLGEKAPAGRTAKPTVMTITVKGFSPSAVFQEAHLV